MHLRMWPVSVYVIPTEHVCHGLMRQIIVVCDELHQLAVGMCPFVTDQAILNVAIRSMLHLLIIRS